MPASSAVILVCWLDDAELPSNEELERDPANSAAPLSLGSLAVPMRVLNTILVTQGRVRRGNLKPSAARRARSYRAELRARDVPRRTPWRTQSRRGSVRPSH